VRGVPPPVRDNRAELSMRTVRALAPLAVVVALLAATPAPSVPLHAAYTVETNKLGQVVRVRSAQASSDKRFNLITRGNALQAFIRRQDGTAVAGIYKLSYDYSPKTKDVARTVQLVRAGGVDPNAKGAVTAALERQAKSSNHPSANDPDVQALNAVRASQNAHLPDFDQIVSPAPSASK
jgi:hypothetical protein